MGTSAMLFEFLLLCYAVAVGFVAAGIVSSLYQLVTARPARFALLGDSFAGLFATGLLCAVCGPMIMVRTAVQGRQVERQPVSWLFGGLAIATIWGCCVGIITLELALSIGDTFA